MQYQGTRGCFCDTVDTMKMSKGGVSVCGLIKETIPVSCVCLYNSGKPLQREPKHTEKHSTYSHIKVAKTQTEGYPSTVSKILMSKTAAHLNNEHLAPCRAHRRQGFHLETVVKRGFQILYLKYQIQRLKGLIHHIPNS